jgi:hypothetical protein
MIVVAVGMIAAGLYPHELTAFSYQPPCPASEEG